MSQSQSKYQSVSTQTDKFIDGEITNKTKEIRNGKKLKKGSTRNNVNRTGRRAKKRGPDTPLPLDYVQSTENREINANLPMANTTGEIVPETNPQPHDDTAGNSGTASQADAHSSRSQGSSSAMDNIPNQVVRQDVANVAPQQPPTGPTSVMFTSGGASSYPSLTGMVMDPSGIPSNHSSNNSRQYLSLNTVRDLVFCIMAWLIDFAAEYWALGWPSLSSSHISTSREATQSDLRPKGDFSMLYSI